MLWHCWQEDINIPPPLHQELIAVHQAGMRHTVSLCRHTRYGHFSLEKQRRDDQKRREAGLDTLLQHVHRFVGLYRKPRPPDWNMHRNSVLSHKSILFFAVSEWGLKLKTRPKKFGSVWLCWDLLGSKEELFYLTGEMRNSWGMAYIITLETDYKKPTAEYKRTSISHFVLNAARPIKINLF